jgi:hypothetical protein
MLRKFLSFLFFLGVIILFIIGIFIKGITAALIYSSPLIVLSVYYFKKYVIPIKNVMLDYLLAFLFIVSSIVYFITLWEDRQLLPFFYEHPYLTMLILLLFGLVLTLIKIRTKI